MYCNFWDRLQFDVHGRLWAGKTLMMALPVAMLDASKIALTIVPLKLL
jgi:hypothetical protein